MVTQFIVILQLKPFVTKVVGNFHPSNSTNSPFKGVSTSGKQFVGVVSLENIFIACCLVDSLCLLMSKELAFTERKSKQSKLHIFCADKEFSAMLVCFATDIMNEKKFACLIDYLIGCSSVT